MNRKLNKEQLIKLVEEIVNPNIREEGINGDIDLFEKMSPTLPQLI